VQEGMALLEKAAGQGHVHAMSALGDMLFVRKDFTQAVQWLTEAAEAGLPIAMFNLGACLDQEGSPSALDHPAAADWYRRAADAGHGGAATNLSAMYQVGRGVTRSKQRAMQWMRKVAENGHIMACITLANHMYLDAPYAREVGYMGEAGRVATPAGVAEGHDVPPDVLTGVLHWLQKGCATGQHTLPDELDCIRRGALEGTNYCWNEGCEVVGLLKDFKVCPQCKYARYCGEACQKQDWTTGGHKGKCGKFRFPR